MQADAAQTAASAGSCKTMWFRNMTQVVDLTRYSELLVASLDNVESSAHEEKIILKTMSYKTI
jgi:hypothetical protein